MKLYLVLSLLVTLALGSQQAHDEVELDNLTKKVKDLELQPSVSPDPIVKKAEIHKVDDDDEAEMIVVHGHFEDIEEAPVTLGYPQQKNQDSGNADETTDEDEDADSGKAKDNEHHGNEGEDMSLAEIMSEASEHLADLEAENQTPAADKVGNVLNEEEDGDESEGQDGESEDASDEDEEEGDKGANDDEEGDKGGDEDEEGVNDNGSDKSGDAKVGQKVERGAFNYKHPNNWDDMVKIWHHNFDEDQQRTAYEKLTTNNEADGIDDANEADDGDEEKKEKDDEDEEDDEDKGEKKQNEEKKEKENDHHKDEEEKKQADENDEDEEEKKQDDEDEEDEKHDKDEEDEDYDDEDEDKREQDDEDEVGEVDRPARRSNVPQARGPAGRQAASEQSSSLCDSVLIASLIFLVIAWITSYPLGYQLPSE